MGKTDRRQRPRDAAPPAAPAGGYRPHLWRLLAIWGLVLAAYSNSFHAGLVFDNASVIAEDPRIRDATPENIGSILTSGYWYGDSERALHSGLYRPFTTLTYLMNYAVLDDGAQPAGYHVINFLLHAANIALVYALGVLVLGEIAPAFALAAVWGLHPVLTESVTNIIGRADLLAAFGVLAGLLFYIRFASAIGRKRLAWLAALAAAQAIGLFSKENAAVLPLILLLFDLVWLQRTDWRRRLPAYAAVGIACAAYLCLRLAAHPDMHVELTENPLAGAGFWTARLTALKVSGMLLWLFLWPLRLSADYSYNAIPLWNWRDPEALLALAACLSVAAATVLLALRRRPAERPILFFLLFFLLAMAPTSNLIVLVGSIMAERFFYLPSVGLAGCAIAVICLLGRKPNVAPPLAWTALGLVCLALAARTYARNLDWQNDRSLWASSVETTPGAARSHYNLALELERAPDALPEAIAQYRLALRIEPDFVEARSNLATDLARSGQLTAAVTEYREALRLRPELASVHANLANTLAQMPNRLPEAIAEYEAALRIRPNPELRQILDRLRAIQQAAPPAH